MEVQTGTRSIGVSTPRAFSDPAPRTEVLHQPTPLAVEQRAHARHDAIVLVESGQAQRNFEAFAALDFELARCKEATLVADKRAQVAHEHLIVHARQSEAQVVYTTRAGRESDALRQLKQTVAHSATDYERKVEERKHDTSTVLGITECQKAEGLRIVRAQTLDEKEPSDAECA